MVFDGNLTRGVLVLIPITTLESFFLKNIIMLNVLAFLYYSDVEVLYLLPNGFICLEFHMSRLFGDILETLSLLPDACFCCKHS